MELMTTDSNEGQKTWYNFAFLGRGSYTEGTVLLMYLQNKDGEEKYFQTIWGRNRVTWNAFDVTVCIATPEL